MNGFYHSFVLPGKAGRVLGCVPKKWQDLVRTASVSDRKAPVADACGSENGALRSLTLAVLRGRLSQIWDAPACYVMREITDYATRITNHALYKRFPRLASRNIELFQKVAAEFVHEMVGGRAI
jgi:hypothetical protein